MHKKVLTVINSRVIVGAAKHIKTNRVYSGTPEPISK